MNSLFPDRVADLINPNSRTWRSDLVKETFWPVGRGRILAIPTGALEVEDRMVWAQSKDGKFSVLLSSNSSSRLQSSGGVHSFE